MTYKRSNAQNVNGISQIFFFRFIWTCPCNPKRINANISEVPHRRFIIFFQWLAYIKHEWFLQELEMACVFAIKISIYIVCMVSITTYVAVKLSVTIICPTVLTCARRESNRFSYFELMNQSLLNQHSIQLRTSLGPIIVMILFVLQYVYCI